jgi:hypothetical protein
MVASKGADPAVELRGSRNVASREAAAADG